jgi:hypothetical protein
MNEMIERIMRASFECWRKRMTKKGVLLDMGQTFEDMSDSEQEFARLHAIAVLEAMREPTDAMLHAYDDESGCYTGFWASDRAEILKGYQSMIEAALEDSDLIAACAGGMK